MHIQFSKISYKNILSVGNVPVEIDLLKSKNTLISGKNGGGKSTSIESIVFALYGKSFRKINKGQLVNSVNKKDMLVELEFYIGKDKFLIKRGIKPNIFEVYKNDVLLNKDAASKDYQEHLETNILKMSYKSFTQIVILGSATYVPFMELPAAQRREIIEDLLDIQVFSTMNTLLKGKISENKEVIAENNHEISLIELKIDSAKKHNQELQKLKQVEVDKLKSKATENLKTIDQHKSEIEQYETQITDLGNSISDKKKLKETQTKVKELLYELKSKKSTYQSDISFYSNHDNCPTCKQGIEETFKQETVSEKTSKLSEMTDAIEKLQTKQNSVEKRLEEISDIEDQIQKLHNKANEHRLSVKMIMNQLKEIKAELVSAEKQVEEVDKTTIIEYSKNLEELRTEQTTLYEQREMLGIAGSMLKDGGIKTSINRTYIPIMNKIINQYLSEFELFVDFNLDENFNETIKSRFRDTFTFTSFSEGEKMRINLSIMFAWRALAKLRNSVSTNLLFLDETLDGAADSAGVESLIDILKKLNNNDNVFVISHRGMDFAEKFDRHIQFEKIKNFTQLID